MINVQEVIKDLPHFDTFCSVEKLHKFAERLRADSRFEVSVAGTSVTGLNIYHVRFGKGSVKALFVGGPHAMEPIGSLTVFSLMSLLQQGNRALLQADVEWHIVPCIDPDGAILNEGWTQKPFTFENYMRNFYLQPRPDQVDFSFPVTYKKLTFDRPSKEALVLKGILDQVRPDFCFTLHNFGPMGGTWFALSRDIGQTYYRQITLQAKTTLGIDQFAEGMRDLPTVRKYYDYLERQGITFSEEYMKGWAGASSQEHLLEIKPSALVFVAELTYGQHPSDASEKETGQHLRQIKLRRYADNKFLAAAILEEWEKVKEDLDATSPFYRKILTELVAGKDKLHEGVSEWYEEPIQHLLFNPEDSKIATERERTQAYARGTLFLGNAYSFVRLLKASKQTPAVCQATERLERLFDEAFKNMKQHIDFDAFEVIDCDRLAKVQLGSGLIALNSVLES